MFLKAFISNSRDVLQALISSAEMLKENMVITQHLYYWQPEGIYAAQYCNATQTQQSLDCGSVGFQRLPCKNKEF